MGTEFNLKRSLLIIDMQQASFDRADPVFNAAGLVERLNLLARRVREAAGHVVIIQFTGPAGTPFGADQAGWHLLPDLEVAPSDLLVRKPASDAFQATDLPDSIGGPDDTEVIVTGCDTEFCIDSTVRSALRLGYKVTVPSDGHSLPDRPHLTAPQIIEHHNSIWSTPGALAGSITVCPAAQVTL